MHSKFFLTNGGFVALLLSSTLAANAGQQELPADHAECSYFGKDRAAFSETGLNAKSRQRHQYSDMTELVASRLAAPVETFVPGGSRTSGQQTSANPSSATIDNNIYGVLKAKNITPADKTNDYEFIRRVTFDLTGKAPTLARTTSFVADKTADKRAKYVEELLAGDAWVDKWTQYFGDMLKNTETIPSIGLTRYSNGREGFYNYIKSSLAGNKPYDQMARELIASDGYNSWDQGELNWILAGRVVNGPAQDMYDQMASNVADTFLAVSQLNCVLCHNGRGHLDTLSLWGKQATRMDAWGFAAFFAPTGLALVRPDPTINNSPYYWTVSSTRGRAYALNTTTGNRPVRAPVGTVNTVVPKYPFGNTTAPANSANLRQLAATAVTTDFQFARATVNYMWKEFFSRGLVDPVKMFDLARLDPDNPPPAPWTLQPSNAKLLKDLSQDFINAGYDLKALQRQIVNSDAYQMSSRYNGTWNPDWEPLHARKLVRRLWAEEITDAVAQTSGLPTTYTFGVDATDNKKTRSVLWAMQLPSPAVRSGDIAPILDTFFRGDRADNDRRPDGSDQQGLTMMNTLFVMNRTKSAVVGQNSSIVRQVINLPDDQLVDTLFLTILSRPPADAERFAANSALKSGNRLTAAENLTWALYNKVDFLFNY